MEQDLAHGIRQLVDIAERSLSDGVGDPTTAYEVIVHLGLVLYPRRRPRAGHLQLAG